MTEDEWDLSALLDRQRQLKLDGAKYTVTSYIGNGGTGEVYRCADEFGNDYALKLYLPTANLFRSAAGHTTASPQETAQLFVTQALRIAGVEYKALKRLDHPHIVDVRAVADLHLSQNERKRLQDSDLRRSVKLLPAMLSEYIHGDTLDAHLTRHDLSKDQIVEALVQVASALDYIHKNDLLHTDVRASNVMIRHSSGEAVLVDFAATKNLDIVGEAEMEGKTLLAVDLALLSPAVPPDHPLRTHAGLYELERGELKRKYFPWLDYMQFALLLMDVKRRAVSYFDQNEQDFLQILINRFDYPHCVQHHEPLEPLVEKLAALHSYPFGVPELVPPSVAINTVSVAQGITIPLTGVIAEFASNRSFERLSRIQQLSLLSLVYPAADYKRSVHALHTFEIARQMVLQLLGTPLFRSLFDKQSTQQLLACALLHDINHFPFLHILQEARDSQGEPLVDNDDVLDLFCSGDATGERRAGEPSIYDLLRDIGIEPSRFKRLLYSPHAEQATPVDQVINSMISSNVDVDKISYLTLDSIFTGVMYGRGIDLPAVLKAAMVAQVDGRMHLAFDIRAISAMENVFMARYWNFRTIYWHHTNRAIMSMILSVVRDLYIASRDSPLEFLRASMRLDDLGSAHWLDERYSNLQLGPSSILRALLESRRGLYKRLYTAHPLRPDDSDASLVSEIRRLVTGPGGYERELELCKAVSERIGRRFDVHVGERDVLVDMPRRNLGDRGGSSYVVADGEVRKLDEMSRPVDGVWADFDLLSQRTRFFVSPAVASVIDRNVRNARRLEIRADILESIHEVRSSSGTRKGVS